MSRAEVDAAKWEAFYEKAALGDGLERLYRGREVGFAVLMVGWAAIVAKVYFADEFTAVQLVALMATTALFCNLADSGDRAAAAGDDRSATGDVDAKIGRIRSATGDVDAKIGRIRSATGDVDAKIGRIQDPVLRERVAALFARLAAVEAARSPRPRMPDPPDAAILLLPKGTPRSFLVVHSRAERRIRSTDKRALRTIGAPFTRDRHPQAAAR